ncbi:MAG: T9SS type A sorting domain-containing protein [Flavobacteriales bacterium]
MKHLLPLAGLILSANLAPAQGPVFDWVNGIEILGTNLGDSSCEDVKTDAMGNVISAGWFKGNIDFDTDPTFGVNTYLNSNGQQAGYLQKVDANGDFVWAVKLGSTGTVRLFGLDVDAAGNSYVSGYFFGTADMDPGPGVEELIAVGGADVFIVKINADGTLGWARQIGGADNEVGYSLVLDDAGNITLAGVFEGTVDMDPGTGTTQLTSVGYSDMFVSKLDPAGDLIWARQLSPTTPGNGHEEELEHTIDSDGNLLVTGWFAAGFDFDPGPAVLELNTTGNTDLFVLKLDPNGDLVWVKQVGSSSSAGLVLGEGIGTDLANNVYIAGRFTNITDFDPGPGLLQLPPFSDGTYILKLDANGDFQWVREIVGNQTDVANGIAVAADGTSYTIGYFTGTPDFDNGPGTFTISSSFSGTTDVYILKLDASGNFMWAGAMGSTSTDFGKAIHLMDDGTLHAIGNYADPADPNLPELDFDPGPAEATILSTAANPQGFFLVQLTDNGSVGMAANTDDHTLAVYPNPSAGTVAIDLRGVAAPRALRVLDRTGRLVQEVALRDPLVLDHQLPEQPGLYLVQVVTASGSVLSTRVVRM